MSGTRSWHTCRHRHMQSVVAVGSIKLRAATLHGCMERDPVISFRLAQGISELARQGRHHMFDGRKVLD